MGNIGHRIRRLERLCRTEAEAAEPECFVCIKRFAGAEDGAPPKLWRAGSLMLQARHHKDCVAPWADVDWRPVWNAGEQAGATT